MGKGSSSDYPDPFPGNITDVRQMIRAMENSALRQAKAGLGLGMINQIGPGGTIQFRGEPGKNLRVVTRLPKEQQRLLNRSRQAQQRMQRIGQRQLRRSAKQLARPVLGGKNLRRSARRLEEATFNRAQNLLQPGFDEQQQRLESSLVQRGIPRNSEAFDREMERLSDQQNAALENVALSSVGAGRQEQSRLLQSDLARRAGTLSQIQGMAVPGAGAQAPLSFGPQPTPQLQGINTGAPFQMLSQAGLAGLGQQGAQGAATTGGLFGLGAAAIPLIFGKG